MAMTEIYEIDARGHHCPVPTLKLRRATEDQRLTGTIRLLADDPMAQIDIPHFCDKNLIILQSVVQKDDYWIFEIALPGYNSL